MKSLPTLASSFWISTREFRKEVARWAWLDPFRMSCKFSNVSALQSLNSSNSALTIISFVCLLWKEIIEITHTHTNTHTWNIVLNNIYLTLMWLIVSSLSMFFSSRIWRISWEFVENSWEHSCKTLAYVVLNSKIQISHLLNIFSIFTIFFARLKISSIKFCY